MAPTRSQALHAHPMATAHDLVGAVGGAQQISDDQAFEFVAQFGV
jgi:hypothetical protein